MSTMRSISRLSCLAVLVGGVSVGCSETDRSYSETNPAGGAGTAGASGTARGGANHQGGASNKGSSSGGASEAQGGGTRSASMGGSMSGASEAQGGSANSESMGGSASGASEAQGGSANRESMGGSASGTGDVRGGAPGVGGTTGDTGNSRGGATSASSATSTTPYVSALTLGLAHGCGLKSNGAVWCWGHAEDGELGTAASSQTAKAVRILGLSGVMTMVSAAENHTCALGADKGVYCWGKNDLGQVSGAISSAPITTPVAISGLSNIAAVDVGSGHACALSTSGTVSCWGVNSSNQLGNASAPSPSGVVSVAGISGATAISAGTAHTCVLVSGKIYCWGNNGLGQLGNAATKAESSATPVLVDGITTATAIAGGSNHTCAVLADKTVRCWGYNTVGQLGINSATVGGPTVVQPQGITNATAVSCSFWSSCALLEDKTVKCWGYNDAGQVGNGDSGGGRVLVPTTVLSAEGDGQLNDVIAIETGEHFACALLTTHEVYCWGTGANYRNGDPNRNPRYFPAKVTGI